MTAMEYKTSDGDTVDYIAWKHYGTTERLAVETVLRANPGLASRGAILPAGVIVSLPAIDTAEKTGGLRLW